LRIVFLTKEAGHSSTPQAILGERLVKAWSSRGNEVLVVTESDRPDTADGLTVKVPKGNQPLVGRLTRLVPGLHRYSHLNLEARNWLRVVRSTLRESKPDAVVTFSNPFWLNAVGLIASKTFPDIRWFAHYSDPLLGSAYKRVWPTEHRPLVSLERQILQSADGVIFCNRQLLEQTLNRHGFATSHKNFWTIPHSYAPTWASPSGHPSLADNTALHLGSLYGPRKPDQVVVAFKECRNLTGTPIKLQFIGASQNLRDQSSLAKSLAKNQDWLNFRPPVSYTASLELMSQAQILVSIDSKIGEPVFLPSKLMEYVGSRRPVMVFSVPGSPAWKLAEEAGFFTLNLLDQNSLPRLIAEAFEKAKNWSPNESVVQKFSAERVGSAWLSVLRGKRN